MSCAARAHRRRVGVALATAALCLSGCAGEDGLVWSIRRGQVGEFAVHGREVFTVGRELAVHDLASGRRLRHARLRHDLANITTGQLGPTVEVAAGVVVFGWYDFQAEAATLSCHDAGSLAPRWDRTFPWPWDERSLRPTLALGVDVDSVYAAAVGKTGVNLFRMRLGDGELVWSRAVERFPVESPLLVRDGAVVVRARLWGWSRPRHELLDSFTTTDGTRRWRTWLAGESRFHPERPLVRGAALYTTTAATAGDTHLYTVRLSDGHTTGTLLSGGPGGPFAEANGILFFGGRPPIAYEVAGARPVWQAPVGAGPPGSVGMIHGGALDAARGLVYVGDATRHLYALRVADGSERARIRLDRYARYEFVHPLKALYGAYGARRVELQDDRLLVGTSDASLFVFRPRW